MVTTEASELVADIHDRMPLILTPADHIRRLSDEPDPSDLMRPDDELVAQIKAVIAELPTYGYRRVHAILKRRALAAGLKPANHKRVYRVMKVHGLLLDRHAGGVERRHDGRIAVDERNRRWSGGANAVCVTQFTVAAEILPLPSSEVRT